MTASGAKVLTVDNLGTQYSVVVRIGFPRYRGSFLTLKFGEKKPFTGFKHNGQLDLVYHEDKLGFTHRGAAYFVSLRALNKFMRTILLGLCALTLFAGLTPKTAAQTVTTTLGAPTVDLDLVCSDD